LEVKSGEQLSGKQAKLEKTGEIIQISVRFGELGRVASLGLYGYGLFAYRTGKSDRQLNWPKGDTAAERK